jgi:hypothetical protein
MAISASTRHLQAAMADAAMGEETEGMGSQVRRRLQ